MQTAYGKQSYHSCCLGMIDSPIMAINTVNGTVGATGTVSFGDLLEFDGATQTRKYKLFDDLGVVRGVCVYDGMKQAGAYAPGAEITVLRQGRIWVAAYAGIAVAAPHPVITNSLVLRSGVDAAGNTLYLVELNMPPGNTVS